MSGKLWTLCIGVNDYGAQVEFPNLSTAVNDACAMHELLAREFGGEGVLLASRREVSSGPYAATMNETVGPGSRSDILERLDELSVRMHAEDTMVFFYAGHGSAKEPGYLVPYGGTVGQVSTYLMYRTLYGALRSLPCAGIWLFLNCCFPVGSDVADSVGLGPARPGAAFMIAAGRPDERVLDRVPGVANAVLSPFTAGLLEALRAVRHGEEAVVACLAEQVQASVDAAVAAAASVTPSTVVSRRLGEVRSDGCGGELRRFGFSIAMRRRWSCLVGRELEVALELAGGLHAEQVQWSLDSVDALLSPASSMHVEPGRWRLRFDRAGTYRFDVRVLDPVSRHVLVRRIVVDVEAATEQPFRLVPHHLAVWQRGAREQARLGIEGGHAPFTCRVQGLPFGVEARIDADAIVIEGTLAEAQDAGTARSAGGGPLAFPLEVRVEDVTGASFIDQRRLVAVGADYVEIPAGSSPIGFPDTDDGQNALATFLETIELSGERQAAKRELERMRYFSPPSRSSTRRFWIRRYPVTNAAWREFLRVTGRRIVPPSWKKPAPDYFDEADVALPVVGIPFDAISEYLDWRGTRLMTGREWGRVTRGEREILFPWGNDFQSTLCNTRESGRRGLVAVDRHDCAASPYGVRDLVGNAAEWVDQRLWVDACKRFMQPFRGGSYRDSCVHALTFAISEGASVSYGLARGQRWTGATEQPWVGFRDVLDEDADPDPGERQDLVAISERLIVVNEETVSISAFAMARYAVSNAEYLEFVRSTGHRSPTHWRAGQAMPFPYLDRHLPVTFVSRRDALGFCLWLSRVRRMIVRLPTPAQWRAAALGVGRAFPWGDVPSNSRCNTLRSGFGRPIAVHGLPEGRSPEGIHQLVGNVCEWLDTGELAGGGWREELEPLARSEFTQRLSPSVVRKTEGRLDDVGFRYVTLPAGPI